MLSTEVHVVGVVVALAILAAISATLYWMLHPPATHAERAAVDTEAAVAEMAGSILVVYSHEIHSEHVLALAARVARRERAQLLVAYVIEVPLALAPDAEMVPEQREALGTFAVAESIARKHGVEMRTEIVRARHVAKGVLDLAIRADAHLIVVGAYRAGAYAGAPLAASIELIAAQAPCDVIIGVRGASGSLLTAQATQRSQPHERQATT